MGHPYYGAAAVIVMSLLAIGSTQASLTPSPRLAAPGVTMPKTPPVWRRPRVKMRDTFTAKPGPSLPNPAPNPKPRPASRDHYGVKVEMRPAPSGSTGAAITIRIS